MRLSNAASVQAVCSLRPGRLQAFCRYPANSHPAKKKRGCEDALRRWRRAKMLPRQEEERSTRCRVLRFVATRLRPTSRSAFLILSLFSGKVFDRPTCSGPEPLCPPGSLQRGNVCVHFSFAAPVLFDSCCLHFLAEEKSKEKRVG